MKNANERTYTSKIVQVGAQLADTRTFLIHWDEAKTVTENLKQFQSQNIFGKASRIRVSRVLQVFRERYLNEESVIASLVTLAKGGISSEILDPILYFFTAQSDYLLHDIVTEFLVEAKKTGASEINSDDVLEIIKRWSDEGKTSKQWAVGTMERMAVGLLATLRDFRVLRGVVNKELAPVYLPIESFAYIACYLKQTQPSGQRLIHDPEWRLFFLSPQAVEHFFIEAQQRKLLEYHAAGPVIRISFPVDTLEEYANVILRTAT